MIKMVEERGVGKGYPPGETRAAIIRFLMDYPDGIEEKKIRDWLGENRGIKEKGSIIEHLGSLKKEGRLILQSQRGKANIWKLNHKQEMQVSICRAMLKGDILAFVHEHYFRDQGKEEIMQRFNTEYVQRAINTTLLPRFKKRYEIESSKEAKLPKELMTFIETGFKMSPTAVLATLIPSHLVDVAVGMFGAALYRNTTRKIDNVSVAIVTLYACLLTDVRKYCSCPGVEDKIIAFLREPHIISTISAYVGWDFTDLDRAPFGPAFWKSR